MLAQRQRRAEAFEAFDGSIVMGKADAERGL
jgi:hypothetical protein